MSFLKTYLLLLRNLKNARNSPLMKLMIKIHDPIATAFVSLVYQTDKKSILLTAFWGQGKDT